MNNLVFSVSLLSALLILVLLLISVVTKQYQFWPPPERGSWQFHTFWCLYRVVFAGILILSFIDFNKLAILNHPLRLYLGVLLAALGFSLAFYITFYLGWRNAHGEAEGLKTKGWYSWSRNPVYLVSFFGFIGWALAINSSYVYILFAFLVVFYIIAPFLEEPWLEKQYGKDYLEYKAKVPRFFCIPKVRT